MFPGHPNPNGGAGPSQLDESAALQVTLKVLTTQREIQGGRPEYHAVLLVDGNLAVSTQVVETALKAGQGSQPDQSAHKRACMRERERVHERARARAAVAD